MCRAERVTVGLTDSGRHQLHVTYVAEILVEKFNISVDDF